MAKHKAKGKAKKKVRNVIYGGGFFGDMWNGIKSVAAPVNDFLKRTKAISTIAGLIPDGRAQMAGKVAGQLGYGKKMRGKGMKLGVQSAILV